MEIRVADVAKEFGETAALRGVSLEVRPGELLALLGPSGSGKTTLLRVIAGLEIPDGGHVLFGGLDATHLPVQKRQVGFVFQHYALFRHLTVAGNIAYGLRARDRARRPDEADIRRRVGELLDLVQLAGYEGRYPAQLSGGQRQRVALARALAVEPRVLLLDEPFGALDAKVRKDLRRWLREIHERTGRTTVFVTHDQEEALELADRVAILNQGRIEQVGSPDEVVDEPASAFVMAFVGETGRLPVRVAGGRAYLGQQPLSIGVDGAAEGEADLYLRPWDVAVLGAGAGEIPAIVRSVRRAGPSRRVEVAVEGVPQPIDVDVATGQPLRAGDRIGLTPRSGRLFPRG
jgi:sulfate/thiosulfate transport system ATP-binding protein